MDKIDKIIYNTGLVVWILLGLSAGVAVIHLLINIAVYGLWLLLTKPLLCSIGLTLLLVGVWLYNRKTAST